MSPQQLNTEHQQLPTTATTWLVRRPVARDLQSTSTVTTSASPSSSSSSSPHPSNSPSPLSTWQIDQYDQQVITPPTTPPPNHTQSGRTLPRCAVVNFRKDGDNLRWAPRVTQNASGVAARVHNFEDAFSLEEFSSKALPIVWHSKGGNPRLSDISKSDKKQPHRSIRGIKLVPHQSQNPPPPPPPRRSTPPVEKRAKSLGNSQRALVRNSSSLKKAVVLATEVGRPSFWSLLAHTSKYQRSKAKARIENESKKRAANTPKRPVPRSKPEAPVDATTCAAPDAGADCVASRKPWVSLSGRRTRKTGRGGKATKRDPDGSGKKSTWLFQRLLSHLDRRNSKKASFEEATRAHSVDTSRMAFSNKDGSYDSDDTDNVMFTEKPKASFRQARHSEGHSSRRVVSALTGNSPGRKAAQRREMMGVSCQDDQYVSFITSEA